MLVLCLKRHAHIVTFLDRGIILVFELQRRYKIPTGTTSADATEIAVYIENGRLMVTMDH